MLLIKACVFSRFKSYGISMVQDLPLKICHLLEVQGGAAEGI